MLSQQTFSTNANMTNIRLYLHIWNIVFTPSTPNLEMEKEHNSPSIEKNIMKPAAICTTLRLPTRVRANKPAFSLQKHKKF